MKPTLFVFLFTALGLSAQTPPALPPPTPPPASPSPTPGAPNLPQQVRPRPKRVAPPGAIPSTRPAEAPIPGAPRSTNTIVVPSNAGSSPSIAVPSAGATNQPVNPAAAPAGTAPQSLPVTPSPAPPAAAEEMIPPGMIDFRGTDIGQVLTLYAELVNRTILRPANLPVQQQVVLKTQTALTKREAIQALDTVLGLNGISMINVGDKFVKAVPQAQAGQEGAAFDKRPADQLPDMGQYVTHVVQLKYAKPAEVVPAITPFAKIQGSILPVESSQMLVLRDYAENVKRMLEMIKEIDVAVPSEFISEVIPIKYALASDIASAVNSLSSGGGGATVGKAPSTGTSGRSSFGGSMGMGAGGGMGGYGGVGGYGGYQQQRTTPFGSTTPGSTSPGGAGSSFTERLQNIIKKASVSGEIQVLGETKIIADERTNSLLIFASREDMKMIKDIVSKLDVVLAQVLIEAAIIEVTLRDDKDIGFSFVENKAHGIGSYFNGKGSIVNTATSAATNAALPGGFSYMGHFGQDLDVTLTALASDSRARILQRPRIQTSHAVEANLFVGESRPYPSASYYGGGAYGGYASIQQINIGVTLSVTPLINPDGLVVMDIHQTIENANGTVNIANVGDVPITSRKEAAAKVAVRDRDTIILGGLIENSNSKSASGVPFLKDIPLLGYLFRSTSTKDQRNELIVLIRPTVLPTPEVAALTAKVEKDKMPGVSRTEAEVQADEARRFKQAEKAKLNE